MEEWVSGKVIKVKHWSEKLFSVIMHADIDPFLAGQFTKIKINVNGKFIQRAYSYVNAPNNKNLELYIVKIPDGILSPRLYLLKEGDQIMIAKKSTGLLILDYIPKCNILWMLSTGTALGPFISILEYGKNLEKFVKIILVHAVRFTNDLSYFPQMIKLKQRYYSKLEILTIVSREKTLDSINGRIPALIADGSLESAVDTQLNVKTSHIMLCGNPHMIHDTTKLLVKNYGMHPHLKHNPGNITSELYWK